MNVTLLSGRPGRDWLKSFKLMASIPPPNTLYNHLQRHLDLMSSTNTAAIDQFDGYESDGSTESYQSSTESLSPMPITHLPILRFQVLTTKHSNTAAPTPRPSPVSPNGTLRFPVGLIDKRFIPAAPNRFEMLNQPNGTDSNSHQVLMRFTEEEEEVNEEDYEELEIPRVFYDSCSSVDNNSDTSVLAFEPLTINTDWTSMMADGIGEMGLLNIGSAASLSSLSSSTSDCKAFCYTGSLNSNAKVRISRFTTVHYTYTHQQYSRSPCIPELDPQDWIDYHNEMARMRSDYNEWLNDDEE